MGVTFERGPAMVLQGGGGYNSSRVMKSGQRPRLVLSDDDDEEEENCRGNTQRGIKMFFFQAFFQVKSQKKPGGLDRLPRVMQW